MPECWTLIHQSRSSGLATITLWYYNTHYKQITPRLEMQEIRLCVAAKIRDKVLVGECASIEAPTSMLDFYAQISLTTDQYEIQKFFLRDKKATLCLFNSIGVYASPCNILEFTEPRLMSRFQSEFHVGSVILMFADQEWKIFSRVPNFETAGFVSLHEEIKRCYKSKTVGENCIEKLFADNDFPWVIEDIRDDRIFAKPLYFNDPLHNPLGSTHIMHG